MQISQFNDTITNRISLNNVKGGSPVITKRSIISITSIVCLIITLRFGENILNWLAAFWLGGVIMGTNLAIPSLIMLSGALLALIGISVAIFYKVRATSHHPKVT